VGSLLADRRFLLQTWFVTGAKQARFETRLVQTWPAGGLAKSQPVRSPWRCDFETCSISQSAHTNAAPRPVTTPRNSRVRAGAESVVNIPPHNASRVPTGHANADAPAQAITTKVVGQRGKSAQRDGWQIKFDLPPSRRRAASAAGKRSTPICATIPRLPPPPRRSMLGREFPFRTRA